MSNTRTQIKTISCDKNVTGATRGKMIYLRREGTAKRGGDHFKIMKTVGEGGSCVCYDAMLLGERKTGRLKEFYPLAATNGKSPFSLERDGSNHVVATADTVGEFAKAREEFVESYHLLRRVMEENRNNADFTSFIPDFSIYYACDEEGNFIDASTAYIWTAPQNLTVFESYIINDIRKHPAAYPEHKLFTVLKTALTLTECIKILHEKGLLHLDIKPENFGIPQRKGKLLTDSITLFDVNTIYSLKSAFTTEYGTEGYCAPEINEGIADNRSDIYSIGCTLFSSLIVCDEIIKLGYSKEFYTKIPDLVENSQLITASETNSNMYLKWQICSILKKCLAENPSKRYQSCTELIADLEKALAYLYPAEINAMLPSDKRLVIMEKELDKKSGAGSFLTLMYHLYKKPLFEFLPRESDSLNILIIGFGNYGQRFLDCCIQMGQIYGKRLNIRIASADRTEGKRDKDFYLATRPALTEFFSVDGSPCDDPYGSITFENREFGPGDLKKSKSLSSEIVGEGDKSRYVFIALGDDKLNRSMAQAIVNAKGVGKCSVNFAYDGAHISGKVAGNPVYMYDDIKSEPLYRDLERMAYNVHLIWEGGIDSSEARARFKDPYCYNSSFANVISIKYKLYSVGISTSDLADAAELYYNQVTLSNDPIKHQLVAFEHRRWVCDKLSDGWTLNRDLESCVHGKPNDKKAKKHVCLVRSDAKAPLLSSIWTRSRWDRAAETDLAALDPLDRVSVALHREYKKKADSIKKESTLLDSTMLQLRSISRKDPKISIAFSEWYSCLTLLWNGHMGKVKEYEKLKRALTDSLSSLDADSASISKTLIKLIDNRFSVILKSMQYTDYKEHDINMMDYIPFILTRRSDTHLAIPFACGSNTAMFGNVASATIADPAQITYLYHFRKPQETVSFKDAVQYVTNYMTEKKLSAKVNFILLSNADEELKKAIEGLTSEISGGRYGTRIQKITYKEVEGDHSIAAAVADCLDGKNTSYAAEENDTPLSYLLIGAGFYEKHPKYRFDINSRRFFDTQECHFLKYIKSDQYLRIADMFASKNSKGYLESPAAFYKDYRSLWQKCYRNKEYIWKKACGALEKYHKEADRLLSVNLDAAKEPKVALRFLIAASAYENTRKLIDFMSGYDIFSRSSEVYYYSTDSCEVNLEVPTSIAGAVKKIFADPAILSQSEGLELTKMTYTVTVDFDRLVVKELDLKSLGKHAGRVVDLFKTLESDFSFITDLSENDNGTVSFTYATPRIKKLLTVAGNILEIYVYHKCLNSNRFDDVATGYEINWDGTAVKSEFDIVLTKGFSGLLIEAKATEDLDQNYYFKLSCLAKEFGINCLPVLIADTVERKDDDNSDNEMQRLRGDMLDIITVFDPQAIDNIDLTLEQIIKEEFIPERGAMLSLSQNMSDAPEIGEAVAQSTPTPTKPEEKKMTKEEFLAQRIFLLRAENLLEHSQVSVLDNFGVKTIGDFLEQTEETFSKMKAKKGIPFTAKYLEVQKKIKSRFESL